MEVEELEWKEVERKRTNCEKAKARKNKRKREMEETALKMKMMIGIGPISKGSVEHFNRRVKDEKLARKMAVEEFLHHYLEFNEEEISELKILDTKHSKDDVIYVALDNEEHIKEIRFRRAACGNDELVVRDFIPPQYHARYMALARKAAERRTEDPELKTQIRWGSKDVEMYTKKRGSEEQFRKTELKDFMGTSSLPEYDIKIKWTMKKEGLPRRKLDFRRVGIEPPSSRRNRSSTWQDTTPMESRSMTRKHSTGSNEMEAKRRKEKNQVEMESDTEMYETPSKGKDDVNVESVEGVDDTL